MDFLARSLSHCLIGVLAIEQLIVEMTYVNKGKTLLQSRRTSINFRDKCLLPVFRTVVRLIQSFKEQVSGGDESA